MHIHVYEFVRMCLCVYVCVSSLSACVCIYVYAFLHREIEFLWSQLCGWENSLASIYKLQHLLNQFCHVILFMYGILMPHTRSKNTHIHDTSKWTDLLSLKFIQI